MSRIVNVVSVALKPAGERFLLDALYGSLRDGFDLAVLPETSCGSQADGVDVDSGVVKKVREAAKLYGTNIVFPLYLARAGAGRINAALVIDRGGEIRAEYQKLYPYWSEFELSPPCAVTGGGDLTARLDFGTIGLAICFDANFPRVWKNLDDLGAELVVWSSAYSAGAQLSAYSLIHHYPIVTCTQVPDTAVYDIDGRETAHVETDGDLIVMERALDLDRRIFHYNFNQDKAERLIRDHGGDIEIEKDYRREQWFILRSKNPRVSARELAKEYGMTELRAYQSDSMKRIDAMRVCI